VAAVYEGRRAKPGLAEVLRAFFAADEDLEAGGDGEADGAQSISQSIAGGVEAVRQPVDAGALVDMSQLRLAATI
jgi:hypothetical protein